MLFPHSVWIESQASLAVPVVTTLLKDVRMGCAECTEDGRDRRIGATEYAGGNGTWKRGGGAERSEETGGDAERIT